MLYYPKSWLTHFFDLRTFDKMLYKKCGNNLYKNALKTNVSDFYILIITNNIMYIAVWLTKIYITYISYKKS